METSELIKEVRRGSAAAQKYLFDAWSGRMIVVCRRYVKNNEDAEERLIDGFYKFFKNISSFRYEGDAALYNWLKKIMVNECLMFLRKKNVFTITSEATGDDIPLQEEALNNLSANEILRMIVQLPVGYRTVFNLYEIEGMAHKEIASLLNISEGTSKSQLSKAKALLQKLILKNDLNYGQQQSQ